MRMVNMDANHALSGKEQLYCGGAWVSPSAGNYEETFNPGTGQLIGLVAAATRAEVDVAPACLKEWRDVAPLERASILQEIAALLHKRGDELAMMDAANCGNPYTEMRGHRGGPDGVFRRSCD